MYHFKWWLRMPHLVFEWDNENTSHLACHRINPGEVEELFDNDPEIKSHEVVAGEDRWAAVGVTRLLRVLVVIFTVRHDRVRTITGWDADKRTKKEYFTRKGT